MAKHLAVCPERQTAIVEADESGKGTPEAIYHLQVRDAYRKEFWLNLEVNGSATFKKLDDYLRSIWLECCGHLSQFSPDGGLIQKVGMARKMGDVFQKGAKLMHIYDFGTSSETVIEPIAVREGKPMTKHPIALLARNLMPEDPCIECEQPATHLCLECVSEAETWGVLCDEHTQNHPHKNYGDPVPLVNSPRLGMCGYDGPATPLY